MAELLGLISGAVGIMGLTIQVLQVVVQFGSDWKDAPEDIKSFVEEVRVLHKTLSATSALVINPNFVEAFKGQESLLQTTTDTSLLFEDCTEKLENFLAKFNAEKRSTWKRGFDRFKDALKAADHRDAIIKLDRACRHLNDIVNIDTARLVSGLTVEIRKANSKHQQWHENEENQKVLMWLSSLEFWSKQGDHLAKCLPGTGQWILGEKGFINWRDGAKGVSKTLWCPGIPGAGKTVTTAVVINHLQKQFTGQEILIAYVYCNYADATNQTLALLVSSLLKQVVMQLRVLPQIVQESYKSHSRAASKLSLEDASNLLSTLVADFEASSTKCSLFFLIDALDEHSSKNSSPLQLLRYIQKLVGRKSRVFVTSRPHIDVREDTSDCIRIDIQARPIDVTTYISSRLSDSTAFKRSVYEAIQSRNELKDEISDKLAKNSQGMFLLPHLHLKHLGNQNNVRELKKALEKLPTEIDETYSNAMDRVLAQNFENQRLALQALKWTLTAKRPLRVEELRHALAIDPNGVEIDEDALSAPEDIVSASAGLLEINQESGTFRLVHFTAKEYFQKNSKRWFPSAEIDLATECISYFCMESLKTFEKDIPLKNLYRWKVYKSYPLFAYAINNIGIHFRDGITTENARICLESINRLQVIPIVLFEILLYLHRYSNYGQQKALKKEQIFPLHDLEFSTAHVAAVWRLHEIIYEICKVDAQIYDTTDSFSQITLHIASYLGDLKTLEALLPHHGNFGRHDLNDMSALHDAGGSQYNFHDSGTITRNLFNGGAKAHDEAGQGALPSHFIATQEGVDILLQNKNSINRRDWNGRTPLLWAAEAGDLPAVKFLINHGANVKARDNDRRGALWWAAGMEDGLEIVRYLVDTGAKVAGMDSYGFSELRQAARCGHLETVRLLVEKGASTNDKIRNDESLLMCACKNPKYSREIAQFLVEKGAGIDEKTFSGTTALMIAVRDCGLEIVRFLVQNGASINRKPNDGTFLSTFAAMNRENGSEIFQFLVENGVRIDDKDARGESALFQVARQSNLEAVQFLVEKGADIGLRNSKGKSVVDILTKYDTFGITKYLISVGATVSKENS